MRILDLDTDRSQRSILLLLTREEAAEMRDGLDDLLTGPHGNHVHVSDPGFEREITLAIYAADNTHGFSERVRQLIEMGE